MIYVSRKEERGITRVAACVLAYVQKPEDYIRKSNKRLITAPSNKTDNIRRTEKQQKVGTQNWGE